jgi:hypothetical protein
MRAPYEMPPLALDGTCVRCDRCGWLDERSTARCAQCEAPLPQGRSLSVELEPLVVEHRELPLVAVTPAAWTAALRGLRAPLPDESLDPAVRETLARHHARCAVLAERAEAVHRHAEAVADALRARRGHILIHGVGSPCLLAALGEASKREVTDSSPALLFVTDRALSLTAKDRRELDRAPYALVSDPHPLREGLVSLHALLALVRPELASTRRSFLGRFAGALGGSSVHLDAALGTLLSDAIVLLDEHPPEVGGFGPIGPIRRWIAAAARG